MISVSREVTKMEDYIECYSEYLKIEKIIRSFLKILNFASIPHNYLCGREKLIAPIFIIYTLVFTFIAMIETANDITDVILSCVVLSGLIQIFTKTVSVLAYSKELDDLLMFIRQVYRVHQMDFVTTAAGLHLKKILDIVKIFLKYFIFKYHTDILDSKKYFF